MKVITFEKSSHFGRIIKTGVFFNESTIFDPQNIWQLYFEKQGFYNARQRAENKMPHSLAKYLKTAESPIDLLLETKELFIKYYSQGDLSTYDKSSLAFDLKDNGDIKILCPLDSINCYRDFYTHEKHVKTSFAKRGEEIPAPWFEIPAYYKGPTTGFIGQDSIVPWPNYTEKLDYELELACVIGRDGKNIKEEEALKHVFGFTILNDISARDIQKKEMAIRLGPAKGKDFCSVLGPVITTMDEFNFKEPSLEMKAYINDELWSSGKSSDAHYSWAQMIAHASNEEWLLSTDVLGSGTVGTGCGLELDRWIQPGDKIILEIEGIGSLKNIIGTPNGKF